MLIDAKPTAAAFWQAYNAADWAALRAMVTLGYIHHNGDAETHDIEFFIAGATGLRLALPELPIEIRDMIAQDDRIAEDWEVMNEGALRDQLVARGSAI